ncbi:MAG: NADAR family protein [Gilliamella sp.]|uniref:NADAR family protein n=1 Tax=unclassified Gilliamella TaxID=2685620 RepID=UPI0025D7CCA4|nr:NADAR family protein [Gilliamella sp.]MCO6536740.1 NADAR family protein [Gilliamella sp.]MCO6549732.1 NADAR family protein [Gilliamella sp.]MCO6551766.1 NADAR family protein [Gilliamella sp.]MCO6559604.1 NADAR family protein [Gilliamella sp.]
MKYNQPDVFLKIVDIDELCQRYKTGERFKYVYFWGHNQREPSSIITKSCFSQWYPSGFTVNDIYYATAEHYMMAAKARLFEDKKILQEILKANNPGLAKSLGRQVRGFVDKIWDEQCLSIVIEGNFAKFSQNRQLADFLLSTQQRVLVEASPTDKIWGIGLAQDAPNIDNPLTWQGKNLLGFALMAVRQKLKMCY